MQVLSELVAPFFSSLGIEGHGEGIKYKNHYYYYRGEKRIPKNKPACLKWEGHWAGRVHGEKEWIIVAWNGQEFILLDHIYGNINYTMTKYKGLSAIDAIKKTQAEETERQRQLDAMEKCKKCGKPRINFGQAKGLCVSCDKNFK